MKTIIPILLICLIVSCKKDVNNSKAVINETTNNDKFLNKKLSSNRENLNISILLDLSDRINPKKYPNATMEYYQRDIGYIKSIAESFTTHLANKKLIKMDDYLQVFMDPEPSDKLLNSKISNLKTHFTKDNITKEKISQLPKLYDSITASVYNSAIADNNYVGSDTWRFFKNKVKDYCIKDNYRNILIILTDGYIYHKNTMLKETNKTSYLTPQLIKSNRLDNSSWEEKLNNKGFGFIPASSNLNNLDVLVIGINPHEGSIYDEDIIRTYWTEWLEVMSVRNFKIQGSDLPTNLNDIISSFIWN